MNFSPDLGTSLSWQMWNDPTPWKRPSRAKVKRVIKRRPDKVVIGQPSPAKRNGRPMKDMRVRMLEDGALTRKSHKIVNKIRSLKSSVYLHLDGDFAILSTQERTCLQLVGVYKKGVTSKQISEDIQYAEAAR